MKRNIQPREWIPMSLILGVFVFTAFFTGQFTYGQFSTLQESHRIAMAFGLSLILTGTYGFAAWVRDEYPEFWIGCRIIMVGITFVGVMGATAYLQQNVQENVDKSGEATELDKSISREDSLSKAWKDAASVNEDGRYWALVQSDKHSRRADSLRIKRGVLNTTGSGAENALYMQMAKALQYNIMTISLVRNATFSMLLDFIFGFLMKVWLRMRRERGGGKRRGLKKRFGKRTSRNIFRRIKASPPPVGERKFVPGNPTQSKNKHDRIMRLKNWIAEQESEPSMKEMIKFVGKSENTVREYLKIIKSGGP